MSNGDIHPEEPADASGEPLPDLLSVTEPVALRALSHPVRLRVLGELALLGRANVAMVAQRVGEPANSVSYHLSVLARHGLILPAEPPPQATRRERWWKLGSARGVQFTSEDAALLAPLQSAVAAWRAELAADWSDRMAASSDEAERRRLPTKQATFGVWLTPDEAREAVAAIAAALMPLHDRFDAQRAHGLAQPPVPDTDYYRVGLVMFPDLTATSSQQGGDGLDEPGPQPV